MLNWLIALYLLSRVFLRYVRFKSSILNLLVITIKLLLFFFFLKKSICRVEYAEQPELLFYKYLFKYFNNFLFLLLKKTKGVL